MVLYCDQTISFVPQRWEDDPELKPFIKKAEPTGIQLSVGAYGSVEQVKVEGAVYAAKRFRVEICMNPDEFYKMFQNVIC